MLSPSRRSFSLNWMSVLLLMLVVSSFFSTAAVGQTNDGIPPYGAMDSHDFDSINLQNLTIALATPVMKKSGAIPFSFMLNASSSCAHGSSWICGIGLNKIGASTFTLNGFSSGIAGYTSKPTISGSFYLCPDGVTYTENESGWVIVDQFGTQHPLPPADYVDEWGCTTHNSFTAVTTDGSGLTLSVKAAKPITNGYSHIYGPDGMMTNSGTYAFDLPPFETDLNGNSITSAFNASYDTVWTDTLNTTALTAHDGASNSYGYYKWTDANSATQEVSETFTASSAIKTKFNCTGITDTNNSAYLVSSINFPDGTGIGLSYEENSDGSYTGRIGGVTLRAGGTISYQYSGGNSGIDCTYGVPPTLTRTTQDGTTTYIWTVVNNGNGNYGNTTTVVDNGGNNTVYTFTGLTSTGYAAYPTISAITEVQRYQGSSTLLTTDVYCYNATSGQPGNCSSATVSLPITEIDVYHTIAGMSNSSRTQTKYDGYGNVIYVAQYDFGASSPTITTTTTYGTWNGSQCVGIGNNIYNKPCDIVRVQSGNTVAEARFTYSAKGNLLTTFKWTGSAWLSNATANTYNTNGTPATTYDIAGNPTTYQYNGTGGCNNVFPTSISKGGLTSYGTWNCTGGVQVTEKDASGNTTTYAYTSSGGASDPFWRVMSVADPYSNTTSKTYASGSTPTTWNTSFTFNSNDSINSTTKTTDGYGRLIDSQQAQSPGGSDYDTVTTAYGWSGNYRTVSFSEVCSTSLGANCTTVHTRKSDPLGRLYTESTTSNETLTHTYAQNDDLGKLTPAPSGENSKQVQNEYDGLGRLTSSCRISSTVSGNVLCGQNTNTTAKGILTSTSYSSTSGSRTVATARGSETRSVTYDALGRVTKKVTPEGGTWNYVYDSNSSCPSGYRGASGMLASSQDPKGDLICYAYDSMSRITGVNANGTSCRHFYYDNSSGYSGTLPTGITLANQYGRMVEAATDSCSANTLITDEWFSYDKDGRTTDLWEKTPHSTQYYHSIATFFDNGKIKTLQLASPSFYTVTYGLDGEGRWKSLTDTTTGQNIVTGATYFPAVNPATVNFTGSDSDSYTFDSNTSNMTQFVFAVGSKSETGALTWNGNRTLKTLAITDGFNSGGTQTCHFNPSDATNTGYDDIGRLVGVDCGSGQWGQTFSYDQYDNLTKAVISGRIGSTYNPGYSTSPYNNHCSICTYDSNGNVTSDGNNNYGWNEFSKLKWTATSGTPTCGSSGECITYDAFGRMVENSSGGSYNELWYTQLGTTVQMAGTTIDYGYFPGPMSGTAIINGNSSGYGYLHKDWLGNGRIVSNIAAHGVTVDQAFSPYGEIYDQFGSTNSPYDMFANLTQNFAPGVMWDTPNRELSAVGRWLSPDPAGAGWNQYAYSTNPNGSIDPSGLVNIPPEWYLGFAALDSAMADMASFEAGFDSWINSTFSSVPANGYCTAEDCAPQSGTTSSNQQQGQGDPSIPSWISGVINAAVNADVSQNDPLLQLPGTDTLAQDGCAADGLPCMVLQGSLSPVQTGTAVDSTGQIISNATWQETYYVVIDRDYNYLDTAYVTEWTTDLPTTPTSEWTPKPMGEGSVEDSIGENRTSDFIPWTGAQFFTATYDGGIFVLSSWVVQSVSVNNGQFSAGAALTNPIP